MKSALIACSPATIIAGLYSCVNFAWLVTISVELPIFLAEPYAPAEGAFGYGFNAQQVALCKLSPFHSINLGWPLAAGLLQTAG